MNRRLAIIAITGLSVFFVWDAEAAVRYVNPSHPASWDSGEGQESQPYKTLSYGIQHLGRGDRLVIAAGTYRESLDLRESLLQPKKGAVETVIEAAPNAKVIIKGSDLVGDWEPLGNGLFVRRNWAVNSQQVFVDGTALKQIGGSIFGGYPDQPDHPLSGFHTSAGGIWPGRQSGGLESMSNGSFYYDARGHNLYIKMSLASLADHVVEVSVRTFLLFGQDINYLTARNLRFEHSNTSAQWYTGAITLKGNHLVLDRLDVFNADAAGFDIAGDSNIISNSSANYCGQLGMKVRGKYVKLTNNETSHNNTRGFNKWWEAGGAKFVGDGGLGYAEIVGHLAYANNGDGIWFDWLNRYNEIHDVVSAYNSGFGLHYEASRAAHIYNSYFFGNGQRGVYLPHSSFSVVEYNLIAGNEMEGAAVVDEGRRDPTGVADLTPRYNKIRCNIIAWNGSALVLPSGRRHNTSDNNLYLTAQGEPRFSLDWPSASNPVKVGLASWGSVSGQDFGSRHQVLGIPDKLRQALKMQSLDPDWGETLAATSAYNSAGCQYTGGHPGPKR